MDKIYSKLQNKIVEIDYYFLFNESDETIQNIYNDTKNNLLKSNISKNEEHQYFSLIETIHKIIIFRQKNREKYGKKYEKVNKNEIV